MANTLPQDGFILLSLVNTKLRDGMELEDFCFEYGISVADMCQRMKEIGYKYDSENNKFIGE
ncbi:MAG: DUF4250 domain-containing protein [Candidatus Coproplasma sp.]